MISTLSYGYDELSRLLSAGDGGADYTLDYDAQDRLISQSLAAGSASVTLAPQYGQRQDGLRDELEIEVGGMLDTTTDYGYDDLLRLTSLTQTPAASSGAAEKRVTFAYTPDGRFDKIERYADTAQTQLVAASQYGYDPLSRLTSLVHKGPDEALATYFWTYDAAGRIAKITGSGGTAAYAYLDDGQLDTATYTGTSAPADEDFDYDANGNRTGGGFVIDAYNRIEEDGVFSYLYDAEGNRTLRVDLTTDDYEEYTWDHRNRLIGVNTFDAEDTQLASVNYAYDYLNQLISRTLDSDGPGASPPVTQWFVHDQGQIVLVLDDAGAVTNRLLWGPQTDLLLADEQVDPTTGATDALFWALGDHQNTIRDLAQRDPSTGAVAIEEHRNYSAFGTPLDAWSVDTLFGSQGRLYDPATGLYNHTNRWRDALQWLSEDPKGFTAGDPNPRRITGNDPVNFTDPDGLDRIYIRDGMVYWQPQRTAWGGYWDQDVGEPIEIGRLDGDTVLLAGKAEWSSRWGKKNSFTVGTVGLQELRDLAGQTNRYFGTATKATVEANIDADITALHGGGALATSFNTGFGRGLQTGGKAVVNAGMDTGIGFITLGTQDGQRYHIPVTQEDLDNGYTTSMIIARFSQELGLGVMTGGLASSINKAGQTSKLARVTSVALTTWDVSGNVSQVALGASTLDIEGLTLQNAVNMAGGGIGLGGHGFSRLPEETQARLLSRAGEVVQSLWTRPHVDIPDGLDASLSAPEGLVLVLRMEEGMDARAFSRKVGQLEYHIGEGNAFSTIPHGVGDAARRGVTRAYRRELVDRIRSMFRDNPDAMTNALQRLRQSDIDHILDLQLNGANVPSNLKALHSQTNQLIGSQISGQLPVGQRVPVIGIWVME